MSSITCTNLELRRCLPLAPLVNFLCFELDAAADSAVALRFTAAEGLLTMIRQQLSQKNVFEADDFSKSEEISKHQTQAAVRS